MNYIREARKAKNMTMKELGEKIGCTEAAVSNYELGKRSLNYEDLLIIAEALDTTVAFLVNGDDGSNDTGRNYSDEKSRTEQISPTKKKLLDAVDAMDEEQIEKLLKLIELVKEM